MWFSSYRVVRLFLWSLVFGAAAGAYYDLFRIARIARKPRGDSWGKHRILRYGDVVLCFLGDLFFWITSAAVYCVFIYDLADGRLRIVSILALFIGFTVWHVTVGRLIVALADKIIYAVRVIILAVCRVTLIPAAKAVRYLSGRLAAFFRLIFGSVYTKAAIKRELKLASKGYGIIK